MSELTPPEPVRGKGPASASARDPAVAPVLFVSDLHLSAERPGKVALFRRLLQATVGRARALYVLGDLFDVWVGDDDRAPPQSDVIPALAAATDAGLPVFVMRGNRDFLLGAHFAAQTNCILLPDPSVIELDGRRTVLTHGNLTLCIRDVLHYVSQHALEHPLSRRFLMSLPLRARRRAAARYLAYREKTPSQIADVVPGAVERLMRRHRAHCLIHGHTHRRNVHRTLLNGQPAYRYVLGDWYREDSVLVCSGTRMEFMRIEEYLAGGAARA